ncbi:MAG: NAD-dependent epimerase/dehydratase family protein [Rhodospirillaceae bacterium]|nr:NAD-dependent epimerase/dehydratase family protein [Rhodospirillaceae bacterium]
MSTPIATIAVTGATGFIGTHLVRALRRDGAHVKALTRKAPHMPDDDLPGTLTWVPGHLENETALRELVAGVDGVIHLAGAIKALGRNDFFEHNVNGTRRLAAAAASQPEPPRFIHVSSLAAREPRLSNYGLSKREAEKALKPFRDRMSISIVRPPAVYGPGDRETLRLFQMAARGFALVPPGPEARLSLIHVEDVVSALLNLLPWRDDPGEPLEIDDGHPQGHDWDGVIAAVSEAVQRTPKIIPLPAPALYLAGGIGTLTALITQKPTVLSWDKVPEMLHCDWVARGGGVPGWTPAWDIARGFKNTANWAISQGLLKSYS